MEIFANLRKALAGALLITMMFIISACSGSKYSSQKITEAENVVQEVEQVEAMDYAHPEFQEAQTKLEEARQLAEKGKHKKAALRADEAKAAAELAEVKTLSQKTDESLHELTASLQSLKDQLQKYREEEQKEE